MTPSLCFSGFLHTAAWLPRLALKLAGSSRSHSALNDHIWFLTLEKLLFIRWDCAVLLARLAAVRKQYPRLSQKSARSCLPGRPGRDQGGCLALQRGCWARSCCSVGKSWRWEGACPRAAEGAEGSGCCVRKGAALGGAEPSASWCDCSEAEGGASRLTPRTCKAAVAMGRGLAGGPSAHLPRGNV